MLNHIYLKNEKWYIDTKLKNPCENVKEENIIRMNVLTSTLKSNSNFKKRVTRINGNQIALIEYIGNYFSFKNFKLSNL